MTTLKKLLPILLASASLLMQAPPSQAHSVTPQGCYQYGKVHQFTTGQSALVATRSCRRMAARHAIAHATQACIALPSNMTPATCSAIAWIRTGWAANTSLHELIRRESTWNKNAVNGGSGACGLFQRLPCPWDYTDSPDGVAGTALAQVKNGVTYIAGRYGTPESALSFHNSHGWY